MGCRGVRWRTVVIGCRGEWEGERGSCWWKDIGTVVVELLCRHHPAEAKKHLSFWNPMLPQLDRN